MCLVGREDIVRSCGAPLVLDSWCELVPEDVVRKVYFHCPGDGVGGEVQEEHPVSMHVFNRRIDTWARRVRADCSAPSRATEIASSSATLVTDAKNALATVIEYSCAFAEYFEAVRVLVTGSSMG